MIVDNRDARGSVQTNSGEDTIVIYNRVPKTGSTSLAGVIYELSAINHYHVIYLNVSTPQRTLGVHDQMRLITNMTNWNERKPAIYHGHVPFIDFNLFGVQKQPIFINMVREPLDRLISYYYFMRYGDKLRPDKIRNRAEDKQSFDECFSRGGADCHPRRLWLQIPYFCGHHPDCWKIGNKWALAEAKRNLLHHYLVVGVTEEMSSFIAVLEAVLPRFYRGAVSLYNQSSRSRLRETAQKTPPSPATLEKIRQSRIYRMESEFYEYAKSRFRHIKSEALGQYDNGKIYIKGQRFAYQKIRPV